MILEYRSCDKRALERLVSRWQPRVYRYILVMLQEENAAWDVSQDVWLAAVTGLDKVKPVQNFVEKYLMVVRQMDDAAFLENFFALERWANDNVPVAGETFREFVSALYQRNRLVRGELSLQNRPVMLDRIVSPLLLLVAERDDLVPPESTLALRHHVGSRDVESMSIDAGHIGVAVSSRAHENLWPRAIRWIADRSSPRREALP